MPCQGVWLGWDINNPFGRPYLPHWQQTTDYLKELLDEGGETGLVVHDPLPINVDHLLGQHIFVFVEGLTNFQGVPVQ